MADYFVRSVNGLDTNDGLSWATAKATMSSLMPSTSPIVAVSDRVFVANDHVERTSTARTVTSPGLPAYPCKFYSVPFGSVPNAVSYGASVGTSTAGNLTLNGSFAAYGFNFQVGTGSNVTLFNLANSNSESLQRYEDCRFYIGSTNSGAFCNIGNNSTSNTGRSKVIWRNCEFRTGHALGKIRVYCDFHWNGGRILAGGNTTYLIDSVAAGRPNNILIENVDLSALPASANLVGAVSSGKFVFRNCRLPAGWYGNVVDMDSGPALRVEMHNCDSDAEFGFAPTNYRLQIYEHYTTLISVMNDGEVLWKVQDQNNTVSWDLAPFLSPEMLVYCDNLAGTTEIAVEVLFDSVEPISNQDIWLEVSHPSSLDSPLGETSSGRSAPLAAPVVYPEASFTWTVPGVANPKKVRVSLVVDPLQTGYLYVRLAYGKQNGISWAKPDPAVTQIAGDSGGGGTTIPAI